MPTRTLDQHLFDEGPKRILSLDGGGVRGALTLEYLGRIEDLLRTRFDAGPDFRLADYFDLIGGTSTGAIIAAGLAKGYAVAELRALYRSLAADVFERAPWRFGLLVPKYSATALRRLLADHFGDFTLGDPRLRTGLFIMTKRLDTSSAWPLTNNPRARYYATDGSTVPNADYPLDVVVRASAAAPHYFEPEQISIARDVDGTFIDGGVSTANNPALQLLLTATLDGYGLSWERGQDAILLVSVGTGTASRTIDTDGLNRVAVTHALASLSSIMGDASDLNEILLAALSVNLTPSVFDREIGDLADELLTDRPLLSYARYNVELEASWLEHHLDYHAADDHLERLAEMDNAEAVDDLAELGRQAARVQVREEHFPSAFDLAPTEPG